MYFQDIQTPRLQFKGRNKFGLTRIFPTNTECKNCHQQWSKNYTAFCPHAFRAKGDSMCHVYPVEDCVKGLQGNLFKLPFTQHDNKLLVPFGRNRFTNQRNVEISVIC